MSSIEKLSIRGIRSFSPNREEIVEFYHPLTVILGDNGSGKTSIIECLKVACTGALPPGARSGQSFIHDPRIAGTNEVKASVRLRFRNRAGQPMVVQRTFQLVQQKTKTTYKALDGVIRVVNEIGEKVSMSHKCAELDRHIPEMLGVSKAILESVIFCHQEESNWPLAEGAVLKKRFDEIFESARYTKALEAINKLKKARASDAKDFKRDLDVLNVKLKGAEEIRTKIEAAEYKLQGVKDDALKLDSKVETAEETLMDMEELLKEINDEHLMMERLHGDVAQKEDSIQRALENIESMMSDTDEQLEVLLNNYDSIIQEHEHAFQRLQDQASQLEVEKKNAQERFTELCTDKGKVEARIEQQQRHVTDVLNTAAEMGTKYQFHTQPLSSQEDVVKSFQAKFQQFVADKRRALQQLEKQNKQRETSLNTDLADVKSKLHHAKEQLKTKQKERGTLNAEKRTNATRLKELSAKAVPSARDISEADKLIEEATKTLHAFKEQNNHFALKSEIEVVNKQLHDSNFEIGQLDEKIKLLRSYEADHFAVEAKRKEVREKESDFQEKLSDKVSEYRTFLNGDEPQDEASLTATIQRLSAVASELKKSVAVMKRDLSGAEQKLHENIASTKFTEAASTSLNREKRELELGPIGQLKRLVEEVSPGEDLHNAEEVLQKTERAYLAAKDKTVRCKNTITFLGIFKKKGIEEKCCPLCVRGLSAAEEELFVKTINEKTDDKKVKDKIKKAEALEESALKKWKDVEATMPSWRKWKNMEDQMTAKSNELNALFAVKRSLQADVKDKTAQVESTERQVKETEDAVRGFKSLTTLVDEVRRLQTKISNEEARLRKNESEMLGANAPSLAQLQTTRDEKNAKVQELNRQLQRKQNELQRMQDLQQQLQNDLHKKKEEKMQLDEQRKEYEAASEEQARLRERERALLDEISVLTNAEPQLEQDARAKATELQLFQSEASGLFTQARDDEQRCTQDFLSFQDKLRKAEEMANMKLDKELKNLAEQISQTKQKQVAAAQALEEMSPQIERARSHLSNQESLKRQIRDNMDYRRLKRDLEQIRVQIGNAQHKISTLPSMDDVSRRVNAAKVSVDSAKDKRSTLAGRKDELENQIREEKIKLRGADYRGVEEKHRQKLIQHETTMMAVSDLDKYYKALDKSLLQYHKKKVEEINTIIKSLWQITYKGQDIDTIELVSGQDLDTGGTKAARSYDYRVVMKKGGALIDMRGRCSAGQKVLAALVIRLALAETFCLNCGILTLDEPTTNLDTENKFGLAQAITDILNARAAQQNFQLVCITHDEEFVQMLSEAQGMDGSRPEFYWRVSREDIGNNRFCSKIERREWRDGI